MGKERELSLGDKYRKSNPTGEGKNVQICLEGTPKEQARTLFLRGHGLSRENTFE